MTTLELDDDTARLLTQLAEQEHIEPAQMLKAVLLKRLNDRQDEQRNEEA